MTLDGRLIRLEPLERGHAGALAEAAGADASLYRWTFAPQNSVAAERYIETAIGWREAGTAVPFAIVRLEDGVVVGSTRFWNIERWDWPPGHPRRGSGMVDGCEIGYTWLTGSAIRTGINTEAKFLMLRHAFEAWGALRVCFHTDARNARSRAALERIGAKFEGILRGHRIASDFTPRDSARFSILVGEWGEIKARLGAMPAKGPELPEKRTGQVWNLPHGLGRQS